MIVAFLVVKFKVFNVWHTNSASMKLPFLRGKYGPKYGLIMPEFSPEVKL